MVRSYQPETDDVWGSRVSDRELSAIIEHYGIDLYRHDSNGIVHCPPGAGTTETPRADNRIMESDAWRYHETFYGVVKEVGETYPIVRLQQASAGGYRLDLSTAEVFDEHFAGDFGGQLWSYRNFSGMSVYLPPERIVLPIGLCNARDLPDLETSLRGAYAVGATPQLATALLPPSLEEFADDDICLYRRYAGLYKSFMRPLLATAKVYHHVPVSAVGSVDTGDWFAKEFMSPDASKGWALIINLSANLTESYLLRPKGLSQYRKYSLTFDNSGRTETVKGEAVMRDGVSVNVEPARRSELLLFEVSQ